MSGVRRSCETLSRNARSCPRASSRSLGHRVDAARRGWRARRRVRSRESTRAERSPPAIRPAVVLHRGERAGHAPGEVRGDERGDHERERAGGDRGTPARCRRGAACRPPRLSTTTGVLAADWRQRPRDEHGVAVLAALRARRRAASAVSRSSTLTPSGSVERGGGCLPSRVRGEAEQAVAARRSIAVRLHRYDARCASSRRSRDEPPDLRGDRSGAVGGSARRCGAACRASRARRRRLGAWFCRSVVAAFAELGAASAAAVDRGGEHEHAERDRRSSRRAAGCGAGGAAVSRVSCGASRSRAGSRRRARS